MLTAHFLFSSVVVQRFSEFSLVREQFSNLELGSDVKLGMSDVKLGMSDVKLGKVMSSLE